jgi:plasmid stabilization system protein ParE
VARVRWSTPALSDLRLAVEWLDGHRGPRVAARAAQEIADAVQRVAAHPQAFAWVGSVYPELASLPREWRRALTRSRRHVIFYRYRPEADEVEILAIRSAGQLPPRLEGFV